MNVVLTEIGFFGPLLIFIVILYLTYKERNNKTPQQIKTKRKTNIVNIIKTPDIYIYLVIWAALNHILNETLKHIIREPRPKDIPYINYWDSPPRLGKYGMPSGHAQQVAAGVTFIMLTFDDTLMKVVTFLIACLTVYQRYIYQKHTIPQLTAGICVGMATGYLLHAFLQL